MLDASHFGRRSTRRFDEYYRCYPMVMAPGAERPELDYGSKIILPASALTKISQLHVQWPITFEMINGVHGKHTHAGALEFIAEEGRVYLPPWIMQTLVLDVGDMIQLKTTTLELARLIKLQPQSVSFLDISDPKAVLERVFRNFATLTKGDVFNFKYNDEVYEMAVLEVQPETEKMGVCMIETDVSVDFAPPLGYVEPASQARGSGTSTPRSLPGGSLLPSGGLLHSQGSMAQAINYGAISPNSAAAAESNFVGAGQRLAGKKTSKTSTPKSAMPVAGAIANTEALRRRTNGPMPLRLLPNMLFLGYEIKPVKSAAEKESEAGSDNQPRFEGLGQSLKDYERKGDGDEGKSTKR